VIGRIARAGVVAVAITTAWAGRAAARTPYDGSWSLTIRTERGQCDASYNFQVQIQNGIITSPGLNRFNGRVGAGGAVRVSVTAGNRHASGSGRLSQTAGRGRWAGYSDQARCSGSWSAQKY
jgi:hypothetical protein